MSDCFLRLIPTQPAYVPNSKAQNTAKQTLESLFSKSCAIKVRIADEIKFVDAGSNFEKVSCPLCGKEIANDWWATDMDKAYEFHFINLDVSPPCCKGNTTLNDLNYTFPQGFARFVIEIPNPNIVALDDKTVNKLEQILGCKLRLISITVNNSRLYSCESRDPEVQIQIGLP
jgi:hypothetical protein